MKRSHVSVDYGVKRDAKLQVLEVIEQLEYTSLQHNEDQFSSNRLQKGQKLDLGHSSSSSSSTSTSSYNNGFNSNGNVYDSVSCESTQSSQELIEASDPLYFELLDVWNDSISISIPAYSIIREGGSSDTTYGSGGSTTSSSPQNANANNEQNGFASNSNPISTIESPKSPYMSSSSTMTQLSSHKKKKFTVFTIQVSCPKKTWYVYRRYNDFRELSAAVSRYWSGVPALPPKNLFFNSNFSPDFLRKRQTELGTWLNILLKERGLVKKVQDIRLFLSRNSNNPPEGILQPTQSESAAAMFDQRTALPKSMLPLTTPITTPNHTPPTSPTKKHSDDQAVTMIGNGVIEYEKRFSPTLSSAMPLERNLMQNGFRNDIHNSPPSAPISMKPSTPGIAIARQTNQSGKRNDNGRNNFNHQQSHNTNLFFGEGITMIDDDDDIYDTSDDDDGDHKNSNSEDIDIEDIISIDDEDGNFDESKESLLLNFNMAAPNIRLAQPSNEQTSFMEHNAHDAAQDLLFLSSAPNLLQPNSQHVISAPPQQTQFVSRHQLLNQQPPMIPPTEPRKFGSQSPMIMRSPPSLSNLGSTLPPPTPLNINVLQRSGSNQNMIAKPNRLNVRKIGMADFELVKVLGKGSFGKVILSKKKDSGALYAIKVLKKQYVVLRKQVQHTRTERSILGKINHPFIVKLHFAFQTGDKLHFVLTYAPGGELFFHLGRAGRFSEELGRFYAAEISLALGYLHSKHVVYRDLKPENVLLDREGHVLLADFGLSKEGIVSGIGGTHSFCGTPEYLAPEVLNRVGHGTSVDWWSLGALLYEMLTGLPPWYSQERQVLFAGIQRGVLGFPSYISPGAQSILKALLQRDPNHRLGSRSDVDEVKAHPFFEGIEWDLLYAKKIKPPFCPCPQSNTSADNMVPNNESSSIDTRNFEETFTRMPFESVASGYNENNNMLMHVSSTNSMLSNGQPRSFNEFAGFTYDGSANALDHIPGSNGSFHGTRTPPSLAHFKRN